MRTRLFIVAVSLAALGGLAPGCDDALRVRAPDDAACDDVRPSIPQSCEGLDGYLRTAGLLNTPGVSGGVFASDGIVYLADGDNGLLVVDACDPARMSVLGSVEAPGTAVDVAVARALAYVAWGAHGLVVVDVGDPESPAIVGTARSAGALLDVVVQGDYAFAADDAVGLAIYEVGDPGHPAVVGVENTLGEARGVCVDGPVAYVADSVLGLRVVSVSAPESPWLVDAVPLPGQPNDVAVWNGIAVVACGAAGFAVVDVTSPLDAAVLAQVDTPDFASDVRVAGGIAYVVDWGDGLLVYDVSLPGAPALVAKHGAEGAASALALARDYAYIADGFGGLRVVDVRRSEPPPVVAALAPPGGLAVAAVVDGAMVYVADTNLGLTVGEWRDGALTGRGAVAFADDAVGVVEDAGFLYVPAGDAGVVVVDPGDPDRPVIVGAIPGTSGAVDVAVEDSVVFTVRRGAGPGVYDLRTQADPRTIPANVVIRGVDAGRSNAYFISVPATMFVASLGPGADIVGAVATRGRPADVVVHDAGGPDEVLLVALEAGFADPSSGGEFSAGVEVYSLADPRNPVFQTLVETSMPAVRVAVRGDYLYVAGRLDGLEVFDIRDPFSPVPVGSYWRAEPVNGVAIAPDAVFLAAGAAGLVVLAPPCGAR